MHFTSHRVAAPLLVVLVGAIAVVAAPHAPALTRSGDNVVHALITTPQCLWRGFSGRTQCLISSTPEPPSQETDPGKPDHVRRAPQPSSSHDSHLSGELRPGKPGYLGPATPPANPGNQSTSTAPSHGNKAATFGDALYRGSVSTRIFVGEDHTDADASIAMDPHKTAAKSTSATLHTTFGAAFDRRSPPATIPVVKHGGDGDTHIGASGRNPHNGTSIGAHHTRLP